MTNDADKSESGGGSKADDVTLAEVGQDLGKAVGDLPVPVAAGLAMLFPPISGIVMWILEKSNSFVRFYAMQSILFGVALFALYMIIGAVGLLVQVPVLGVVIGLLLFIIRIGVGLVAAVMYILALINAFTGVKWKIPTLGEFAENYAK